MIKQDNKKKLAASSSFLSLRVKLLFCLIFATVIGVALYFLVNAAGKNYIDVVYLSQEKISERETAFLEDLQAYVKVNGLTSEDADKFAEWAQENQYLYLVVFKDDKLLFESGSYNENDQEMGENKENVNDNPSNSVEGDDNQTEETDSDITTETDKYPNSGITVKPPTREELITNAISRDQFPIEVEDGIVLASMVDYTEYLCYDILNIVSIAVAFLAFLILMWMFFYGITRRISKLGREVRTVAEGNTDHPIAVGGYDEITGLAMDVEHMRSSMLENVENEKQALEANKELITAMSHDIRTPLTVLLGYIDIMKMTAPEGQLRNYIDATEKTALRLKKMSDDMFGYFLVYGGDTEVNIQECIARTLMEQILSGHIFLLREQGYTIDYNFESEESTFLSDVIVVTDPPQLMRIIENIFSNIVKYADKLQPISIFVDSEVDEMTIKVVNLVDKNANEAQKNGIGMKSCMKLSNAMDIRFSYDECDGFFTTHMYIPIIPQINYDEVEEEKGGFDQWLASTLEKWKSLMRKVFLGTFSGNRREKK